MIVRAGTVLCYKAWQGMHNGLLLSGTLRSQLAGFPGTTVSPSISLFRPTSVGQRLTCCNLI